MVHVHRERLGSLFDQARGEAGCAPSFVERQLRATMDRGDSCKGFLRAECDRCRAALIVPFTMVKEAAMTNELATMLKEARQAQRLTLEAVATPARISAAYLHKLEQGGVGSPSPRVLRRVAGVLSLPYLVVMEACGYLDEAEVAEAARRNPPPRPHPLADQGFSADEWRAVGAFIATLKASRAGEPETR